MTGAAGAVHGSAVVPLIQSGRRPGVSTTGSWISFVVLRLVRGVCVVVQAARAGVLVLLAVLLVSALYEGRGWNWKKEMTD